MGRAHALIDRLSRPTVRALIAASILLIATDQALRRIGGDGLDAGILDETAHLMTGLLILAALFRGARTDFSIGLLAGSVLIDADHIPQYLGDRFLTEGTQRPYSHSLLTLAVLLTLTVAWPRRRYLLAGLLIGVAGHFGRDLSESSSGVPLLWPVSYHSYTSPHWIYLVLVGALCAVALLRAFRDEPVRSTTRRSVQGPELERPAAPARAG